MLLDRKLIAIDEIPGSGIEVCDLLDVKGKRLIHVKKSSRQSSVLSHFFKQGGNSAQVLKKYEQFKTLIISKVEKDYGEKTASELTAAFNDTSRPWTVEYQIADFPRKNGEYNIPFFSKLTLQKEARNIGAMGFKVQVGFIKLMRIEETVPIKEAA